MNGENDGEDELFLYVTVQKTYTMLILSCLSSFSRLISSSLVTMVSEKEKLG